MCYEEDSPTVKGCGLATIVRALNFQGPRLLRLNRGVRGVWLPQMKADVRIISLEAVLESAANEGGKRLYQRAVGNYCGNFNPFVQWMDSYIPFYQVYSLATKWENNYSETGGFVRTRLSFCNPEI